MLWIHQNFESVRALVAPRLKMSRGDEGVERGTPAAGTSSRDGASGGVLKPPKKKQLNPIIIISPSSTALISMHNVKKFLEDSV